MDTPDDGDRLVNGRYRLIEVIGRGGMGTVWHGHDEMLDREVAIKEITLSPDLDDEARAELGALAMQEARATARLSHPGIITIFDVIEDDGVPIIVMELLAGDSLAGILKEEVRLPYRRVAEIGAAMLDALREAHAAGIVHRDLKPANVLITDRRVVLTDFGVAQRVGEHADEPGDVTGTPAFMAPEQAENAAASPAADLWALGATLFNAVEGRPPYQGPDYVTVLLTLLTQDPPAPVRAGPLAPVITALLRKDPARRPPADQVADQLAGVLRADDGGMASRPVTAVSPTERPSVPPAPAPPPRPPAPAPPPLPPPKAPGLGPVIAITPRPERPASLPKAGMSAGGSPPARPAARSGGQRRVWAILTAILGMALLGIYLGTRDGSPDFSSGAGTNSPSDAPSSSQEASSSEVFEATAFSPDGKSIAFGGESGVVRLYDAATHKALRSLKTSSEDGAIIELAFSPDNRTVAAELDGGTIDLWDLGTRKKPRSFQFDDVGQAMGFSSDGRTLIVLSSGGHVGMWTVRTGKYASSTISLPADAICDTLAVSPDGHDAACGYPAATEQADDNAVIVWDARKSRQVTSWPSGARGTALVFSPDGRTLAFPDVRDGSLLLWDIASHRQTGRLATSVVAAGQSPAFSPDGRTLALSAFDPGPHQETIELWKVPGGKRLATLPGPDGLHALALGPGAGTLALATDGGGTLWSVKSQKKLASWTG